MKRIVSLVLVCILMVGVLASCGSNVSEAYAKKISDAAADGKHYVYADVLEDLGEGVIDATADVPFVGRGGALIAVKGVTTKEDLQKRINDGEDVEGIVVVIVAGKATGAEYGVITAEDLKWFKQ